MTLRCRSMSIFTGRSMVDNGEVCCSDIAGCISFYNLTLRTTTFWCTQKKFLIGLKLRLAQRMSWPIGISSPLHAVTSSRAETS